MKALFKPTSYRQGTVFAVGATFVWKLISFINALLLAAYFGATYKTDIYFYLLVIMSFGSVFTQQLNNAVLIPEAMFLQARQPQQAQRFLTMWLYIYVLIGILVVLAGGFFPVKLWDLFSRFETPELTQQHTLLILGFGWFSLQLIAIYLQSIAEMYKYFSTAWLGTLNAFLPLCCLLLFGKQLGLASMLYGFIAANVIQIVVLLGLCKVKLNWDFKFCWTYLPVRTRQNMLAHQSLTLLGLINSWLPLYLMSGLNAGVISALNYCKQLTDSTVEIFSARVSNVAKIALTENAATANWEDFDHTFLRCIQFLAFLLAPLTLFSCYFAPYIVEMFFQRGQFSAQAAHETVLFLRPMLIWVLLSIPGYLQGSAIPAHRKIKENFPYALAAGIFFTITALWFIPHCGAFSYPYLCIAVQVVGYGLNAFLFKKHLPFISYAKQFWNLLSVTLKAGLALLPAVGVSLLLPANCWIQILVCGTVFVAVYATLIYMSNDGKKLIQFCLDSFF
ncbi:MAG: hypothetical protein J6X06_01135 [Elusimicrobiaceae bacterium]|nr:hypothetical protein [Elusimicrobiaceae bacterium]